MKLSDLINKDSLLATRDELNKALGGILTANDIFNQLDEYTIYRVEFEEKGDEFLINLEAVFPYHKPPRKEGKVI